MSKKNIFAMIIGVGYSDTPRYTLPGTYNDVMNVRSLLQSLYSDKSKYRLYTRVFYDTDKPNINIIKSSKANILHYMNSLAKLSHTSRLKNSENIFYFFYAGHGYQLRDSNNDELDGKDEYMVTAGFGKLTDDELTLAISKMNPSCMKIRFIFDCCHSGTKPDLAYRFFPSYDSFIPRPNISSTLPGMEVMDIISLSASKDSQNSFGVTIDGKDVGLFTYSFMELLENRENCHKKCFELTRDLYNQVLRTKRKLNINVSSSEFQHLLCHSSLKDNRSFFVF